MRKLILILILISQHVFGEQLEDALQMIEHQYNSNEPNFVIIRKKVGELNKAIAQRTYPFKNKALWWEQPADDLVLELEEIANILTPYESMLIDLAYYEGMQQGHPSTLTTLLNARPTSTLKAGLENYLFGGYSRQVPAKSLLTLYELNLADEMLYKRLFREISEGKYRAEDFHTLRLLSSRKEPVEGLEDTLLDMMAKQSRKYSVDESNDIIELSVLVMAYAEMIDGMGTGMISVASELEKLVLAITNSPHADEVLAIYPNMNEYIVSIIERARKDQKKEVPPFGYGLVIRQSGSASSEPLSRSAEAIEEVTAPEPVAEEPAEVVVTEPSENPKDESSNWWLWLFGAVVVAGSIGLIARRKN